MQTLPPARPRRPGSPYTPIRLLAFAVLTILCASARPASAQLLSRFLPEAVPGYQVDPVMAVIDQGGPDYRASGVRVGDFIIRPTIDETVGFNEDPLGLSEERGSATIESAGSVNVASDWSRNSFGLSLGVDDLRFPELPIADQTTATAFIGGRIDIGQDSLDLGAGHISSELSPTNVLTQGLTAPLPYQSNDARAAYTWHFNRLTVTPSIDLSTYSFGTAYGGTTVISDTGLDKNQIVGGATAKYEFYPGRNAVLAWQETAAFFQHRAPGALNPNYLDTLVLGGLEDTTDALVHYSLLAGYEQRSFASAISGTLSAPVVEASLTLVPTRLTTLSAVVIRHLADASYNVAENIAYTEGVLRADHTLRRNILLSADVDVAYADGNATNAAHTQLTAGLTGTWLLSRYLHLSANYTFSYGSNTGDTLGQIVTPFANQVNVSQSYVGNAFTITVHLQI